MTPVDWNRRLAVASVAMLFLTIGFWFTVLNPRQYITQIQNAMDNYPGAAYQSLRRFPRYAGTADELMAQFWERRALRDENHGKRDKALLERLQAIAAKSTDLRRGEAARLIKGDYQNLVLTLRHGDTVSAVAFSPDGKRVLTGSGDGTARMWAAETDQSIRVPVQRGDPAALLAEWERRLGLKFDENHKIGPIYPVESIEKPRLRRAPGT